MAKTKFKYRVDNGTMDDDDSHEFESNFDSDSNDGEWLAEAAADDFHSRHDGWESRWPLEFVLMEADSSVIGTFIVERETMPQFSATRKD